MAKYDNSGSLSRNERKEQPNHADYKGKATVAGVEYWLSGWIKENEKGKWLSLAFQVKEAPAEQPTTRRATGEPGDAPDSDIPFIVNATMFPSESLLCRRLRRAKR